MLAGRGALRASPLAGTNGTLLRTLGGRFHGRLAPQPVTVLHAQQPGKPHAGSIDPALDGAFGYALDGCDLLICHALGTDQQSLPLPAWQVDRGRRKQKSP